MFPAPAGMNRCPKLTSRAVCSVPRASGDEPGYWTDDARVKIVFPAPAGMNRLRRNTPAAWSGVPRASGDEPPFDFAVDGLHVCSPRQRG